MRVILFFDKCLKFSINFKIAKKQKMEKKFFVFEIIVSELGAVNCLH